MTLAVLTFGMGLFFFITSTGATSFRQRGSADADAGRKLLLAGAPLIVGDSRADLSRAIRTFVRRPHHLRRHHVYRRTRHGHRHAARRHCAGGGRNRRRGRSVRRPSCPLARSRRTARRRVVSGHWRNRRVCRKLCREAEPARARAALYHAQHRVHPAGVRAESDRAAPVSGGNDGRGGRRREQPGDAAEHSALGLAGAAGHVASAPGNPHVLRLSRYRHRSLRHRRNAPAGHARHARAERLEAAREQPNLGQREAGLHARVRDHDERRQRLYPGRPAHPSRERHAGAERGGRA